MRKLVSACFGLLICMMCGCKTQVVNRNIVHYVPMDDLSKMGKETKDAIQMMHDGYAVYAFGQLKQASDLNDVWAQFFLAQCYEFGYGTAKNESEAARLYRKTSERGLAVAQVEYARCLREGIGTYTDMERSQMWSDKASNRYVESHITMLKTAYENGIANHKERYEDIPKTGIEENRNWGNGGININGGGNIINIGY